jgi:hypothetical protein
MINLNEGDRQLFLKILREQASADEIRMLDARYSSEEQKIILNSLIEEYWHPEQDQSKNNEAYHRIADKIKNAPSFKSSSGSFDLFYLLKIAAVLLIFLSVSFFLVFNYQAPKIAQEIVEPIQWITASTAFGEKRKIELPDQSLVHLNYNSSITYPDRFEADNRKVQLKGEAYFEVTADSARPFTVTGERLEVTVLGTSFNFNALHNQVALDEGKVRVGNSGFDVLLAPGEKADLNDGQLLKSEFQAFEVAGWKEGSIYIEDMTVQQIFDVLENWYGVQIQTEGRLNLQRRFSGNLNNITLSNILDGLCFTLDCNFKIDQKIITVYAEK